LKADGEFGQNTQNLKDETWECGLTILSIVHVGFAASGKVDTQLSMAYPPFEVDPPQAKIPIGSVYGAY
jgi:hypothetical protein